MLLMVRISFRDVTNNFGILQGWVLTVFVELDSKGRVSRVLNIPQGFDNQSSPTWSDNCHYFLPSAGASFLVPLPWQSKFEMLPISYYHFTFLCLWRHLSFGRPVELSCLWNIELRKGSDTSRQEEGSRRFARVSHWIFPWCIYRVI